jgi:hypothetical protein
MISRFVDRADCCVFCVALVSNKWLTTPLSLFFISFCSFFSNCTLYLPHSSIPQNNPPCSEKHATETSHSYTHTHTPLSFTLPRPQRENDAERSQLRIFLRPSHGSYIIFQRAQTFALKNRKNKKRLEIQKLFFSQQQPTKMQSV